VLVVCGLAQFFFVDGAWTPNWKRFATSDGVASVEFPGAPQTEQVANTVNEVKVSRTTLRYVVPFRDITMLMSVRPLAPGSANTQDTEGLAAMKAAWREHGMTVVNESTIQLGRASGFDLALQGEGATVRAWTRIVITPRYLYDVTVATEGSYHEDPIIRHFLESFRIDRVDENSAPAQTVEQ
jgi:hypothetical protein